MFPIYLETECNIYTLWISFVSIFFIFFYDLKNRLPVSPVNGGVV